ncbi:MAG: hypothetical protein COT90_00530 [Candidatus Diapherotrites archaeon CG10_big_fil_rev_8_21_14_0_10_31_34]|nr:MAG: hypothetical protein COT90_00530 [Candidatus Diapherotrites archaeon CG10_big_fil_rev_8_21_14_0_10_31_34]
MNKRDRTKKQVQPVIRDITPGQLYKGISYSGAKFGEETKLVKKKEHWFILFCRKIFSSIPSLGKGAKFSKKNKEAIDFLAWDLKPEEFSAAIKFTMIAAIALAFVLFVIALSFGAVETITEFTGSPLMAYFYLLVPLLLIVYVAVNFVQKLPLNEAKIEQVKALTHVPEIMGYMIMSMKLVPNLEKAVEFAALHGRGKIAEDLKRVIWNVELGIYKSLSEGLDTMAYNWGKFSDEFKSSLMMIRASVLENSEAKRYQILDKTMEQTLESIKNKMEQYARELSQPTVVLFYLGVLLPLMLIIVLPVGSAFSGQGLARPEILVLIYNILIPATTLIFALNVLRNRPPTYEPPIIPDNHPSLPKKFQMQLGKNFVDLRAVMFLILIIGGGVTWFFHLNGIILEFEGEKLTVIPFDRTEEFVLERVNQPASWFNETGENVQGMMDRGIERETALKQNALEKTMFFMKPENDVTPYNLIFGSLITFSLMFFVYFNFTSVYKRKVQEETREMESEFKDSLYVIASRMGENKPVEDALRHAQNFLPDYVISQKLFGKTVDNINLLGMPLENAVFDPNYGALKNNPSSIIRSSMKLLVDSVKMGVDVSARTLMSLSLQLKNSEKVNNTLSILVKEITSTMKTMAVFIAPIVLGITIALQKIVMISMGSIISEGSLNSISEGTGNLNLGAAGVGGGLSEQLSAFSSSISSFKMDPQVFASLVSPAEFTLIIALYVIQIVVILTFFTSKLEEDNNILATLRIARALPIALTVFVIAIIVSNTVVGGFT